MLDQFPQHPTLGTPSGDPVEELPTELLDGVLYSFHNEESDDRFAEYTENCFCVHQITYIEDERTLELYRRYMLETAKLNGAYFSANLEGKTEDWVLAEFPGRPQEVYSPDAFMRGIAVLASKQPKK